MKKIYLKTFLCYITCVIVTFVATFLVQMKLDQAWYVVLLFVSMVLHICPLYVANYFAKAQLDSTKEAYKMQGVCGTLFGEDKWPTLLYGVAAMLVAFAVHDAVTGLAITLVLPMLLEIQIPASQVVILMFNIAFLTTLAYTVAFAACIVAQSAVFFAAAKKE